MAVTTEPATSAESTDTGPTATTLEVDGQATTVRRAGSGRTVLYLHGAFFPTRWTPFHDRLAARVDLVAPVHPGYPEGDPPAWLRGIGDLVLHYRSLLDTLELEQVDLVGYDLGGWIAGQLAAHYAERVRSFTVVSPTGLRLSEHPPMEYLAASPAALEHALFGGSAGEHADLFADPDDIGSFCEAYGENAVTARLIWERHYDVTLERRLARVTAPSLVVSPEDDLMVPVEHARRWAELLSDSRLVTLPDVGHALLLQAPDRVADTIASFIEEVAA